jgi:putative DNA primase/helicase
MTRPNGNDVDPGGIWPRENPYKNATNEELNEERKRILNGQAEDAEPVEDAGKDEPWDDPEDLGCELPPVSAFDLQLLPESLRPWVEDVADRMQVPVDFPATAALAALAGVCNRRAEIQPKAYDSSWKVVPNLWSALIGPPGDMKTPTIQTITDPARGIETDWRNAYENEMRAYEKDQEIAELDILAWKIDYQRAKKAKTNPPSKPESSSIEPVRSRLITTDATMEALHKLLAANPAGIFIVRDELTGWLAALERLGREHERPFWLECWNGNGLAYDMERIIRGSLHVPHCCASILGGVQPARLYAYIAEALRNGPANDGLIQRFQLVTWPDPRPRYIHKDRVPHARALHDAELVYQRIARLSVDKPERRKFDSEAQPMFDEWITDLEMRLREDAMNAIMIAHLAKFRSFMPSLALLLALADNSPEAVRLVHAQKAADLCTYYEQHAGRMYTSQLSPERKAALSLGRKLRKGWKRKAGKFTVREVYFNDWSGLGTPDEVRAALRVLEEAKWVRLQVPKADTGRPSEIYAINPKIGGVCADDDD